MKRIILAVAALVVLSSSASAQPITGGGGLQRVIHDNTLTGEGTTPHPLGVSGAGGLISGTLTSPDLVVATGPHAVGNFAGSDPGACAAGSADTHPALSATGTLSKSCAVFVNAAGTGLSLSGSTLSLPNTGPGVSTVTYATISIDAQGRVTAASSGATPALAATTISAGTMLSGGGDLSANRTINLADIATSTVIGRVAAGTGAPSALTTTQLTTLVNPFSSTLSGAVPASGGSSTAFLNGAGGWTVPAGTGVTGTGTTNTTVKYTNGAGGVIGNAWPTDDATTWGVASRFTITEANGNFRSFGTGTIDGALTASSYATFAGTPTITASTLTIGFTAPNGIIATKNTGGSPASNFYLETTDGGGVTNHVLDLNFDKSAKFYGTLDMTSTKITNLANGSSAQDAAAFGQLATAVNAAVSGTSGRSARFPSTNVVGTGAFTDDGTNATIGGTLGVTGAATIGDATAKPTSVWNGTLHQLNASGSAGVVVGTSTKDWTFYMNGTSLGLHEYTTTLGGGGGSDWLTVAAGGAATFAGTLTSTGALTASSTEHVVGAVTDDSTLSVASTSTVGTNLTLKGDGAGTSTTMVIQRGGAISVSPSSGTALQIDTAAGNSGFLSITGSGPKGLVFGNGTSNVDGYITYDNTARTMVFQAGAANMMTLSSSAITMGSTTATTQISASQIDFHGSAADSYFYFGGTDTYIRGNGSTAQVFIGDNSTGGISLAKVGETTNVLDLLSVSYSQTAQASDIKAVNVSQSGTVDVTATNRSSYGIKITNTTSKSAGNNSFAVYGVYSDTSGAGATNQIGNFGMFSNGGDVAVASGGTETHTLKFNGHENTGGTALVNGDLSSCGTTPTIGTGSTDMAGLITEGTTATGCTLTYKGTYTVAPFCTCTGETSGGAAVLVGCSTTATTMVVANASATGDKIYYQCIGQRGGT